MRSKRCITITIRLQYNYKAITTKTHLQHNCSCIVNVLSLYCICIVSVFYCLCRCHTGYTTHNTTHYIAMTLQLKWNYNALNYKCNTTTMQLQCKCNAHFKTIPCDQLFYCECNVVCVVLRALYQVNWNRFTMHLWYTYNTSTLRCNAVPCCNALQNRYVCTTTNKNTVYN